jgi:hypothetical protein
MASGQGPALKSRSHKAPEVVAPTNKVNVALPFSKITVEEPGKDLVELSAVVAELAAALESVVAEPAVTQLRQRAQALAARMR